MCFDPHAEHPLKPPTGYVPGAEALSAVKRVAEKSRQQSPDIIYLLDRKNPSLGLTRSHIHAAVLGDSGHLYVASEVIPIYRSMLALATIITPNWFEVEYVLILIYLSAR